MGELDGVRHGVKAAAVAWLEAVGQDLEGKAVRDAPIKEGTLRGSGKSDLVEEDGAVWVEVSFSTPYAARQHEELGYEHPKGGKAKYLEANLLAESARYEAGLAAVLGRSL